MMDLKDMSLEELIALAISEKQGDKDFILSCYSGKEWNAGVGNPTSCVALGEVEPEIEARAHWRDPFFATPKEAVIALVEQIRKVQA